MRKFFSTIPEIIRDSKVKNIMSSPVTALKEDDTIDKAVSIITGKDFSTIVITKGDIPVGIISEKEILGIVLKGKNSKKIMLSKIMNKRFLKISPEESLLKASSLMDKEKKILVVDKNGFVVGILTQTDIIKAYNRIYNSYRYMLWSPYPYIILFLVLMLMFLINLLIFKR